MTSTLKHLGAAAVIAALAVSVAGCGDITQGRSPARVVIQALEGASGAQPDQFGGTLNSDVVTLVQQTVSGQQVRVPTIYNDLGRVTMRVILADPGQPGITAVPTPLNQVTISRYRVIYRRSDGRNTPGVDVPQPFDSAVTFTVPPEGTITATFELVRHAAKEQAPLFALRNSAVIISTIAEVTFYGRDQAGNDVAVTGTIGVQFGNFGDPQ